MSKRNAYKRSRKTIINKTPVTTIKTKNTKSKNPSYNEAMRLMKQANAKITKLTQGGYKSGTWASKRLQNKLQTAKIGAWHRGRIKIKDTMTETQLTNIKKSINQFLSSSTSTVKGIEKTKKKTKESLAISLSDEQRGKLSDEDVEFYYDMLGNDDFDFFGDKLGSSTMWALIDDAIENNDTEKSWLSRLENYITLNDEDVRNRAIRLYDKYIA